MQRHSGPPHGEQSARADAGRQTVWPVNTEGRIRDLCAYHRGVVEGNGRAANELAKGLGLGEQPEGAGDAKMGTCDACKRKGDHVEYELKLLTPGLERKQRNDSKRPRKYDPAKPTKPLEPLRQSENSKLGALHNPSGEHAGLHPHEWYHGSVHEFDEFHDPMENHPLAYQDDPGDDSHWNTILGNHFTAQHSIAERFAGKDSSHNYKPDDEAYGDDDEEKGPGQIIHAKLHIRKPKTYRSEHDMDQEAYEDERARGNHIDNYLSGDRQDDEDEYPHAHRYAMDSQEHFKKTQQDHGAYADYRQFHPVATGWLNSHPDKMDIAARFKKKLQQQGYDGIVYGNEFEQDQHDKGNKTPDLYGHPPLDMPEISEHNRHVPQHSISAIAFDPEQIEVTQRHGGKEHLTPEEAERQKPSTALPHWKTPYRQPYLPSMDDLRHGSRTAATHEYKVTVQGPTGYEDKIKSVEGPLYHGGRARLGEGGLITPGRRTNSWGDEGPKSRHVFFTTNPATAQSYATESKGHIYEVEPTGPFHPDYNGEDFKSQHPLRVIRKVPKEEWGARTAAGSDAFSRFFTPIPPEEQEAQRRRSEPQPERINNRTYSLNDVSKHYDWEGFDEHEISHLVHNPSRAQFSLEHVPVGSLRHGSESGHLQHIPSYHDIVDQDEDEQDRMNELERGYDQGSNIPPIVVVRDGKHHIIADGSHRAAIHARNGETHIPAFVTERTIHPHTAASVADDPGRWKYYQDNWDQHRPEIEQTKDHGAFSLHAEPQNEYGDREIHAITDDGRYVGQVYFGTHPSVPGRLEGAPQVHPDHRRRGIASAMYDYASEIGKAPMAPADQHTDDAAAFWRSRTASGGHYCKICKENHQYESEAEEHQDSHTDWDKHYPSVGEIHRGIGVHLPQELHDRLHADDDDLEEEGDSRGEVMHDLVGHLNTKPGGWHWTTDRHRAGEFAEDYGGLADDDHGTPLTHVILTGHRPAREHIETDPHRLAEDEHGGGVSTYDTHTGEREVPLKQGTRVHIKSIDWKEAHGHGSRGYDLQDDDEFAGPRHVTAAWKVAALENPYNKSFYDDFPNQAHDRDTTHPEEWYHGSTEHFTHFDNPSDREHYSDHESGPHNEHVHWNNWLGTHFSSREDVAADFSRGDYHDQEEGEEPQHGSVTHAKLHIKNPKIYKSEFDMDREAYGREYDRGNHPFKHDENFEEAWQGDPHLGHHQDLREQKDLVPNGTGGHNDNRTRFMRWLGAHPDSKQIGLRFKKHLEDQEYDGVVYGNEIERAQGQGATHPSAAVFHPHQIEITQHHIYDQGKRGINDENPYQCKQGEEAKEMHRTYPPVGHPELPFESSLGLWVVANMPGQHELFHAEPTGKPYSPKEDWHERMIKKHYVPGMDPELDEANGDKKEDCEECNEEHSPNEGHRECRYCGERHQHMEETEEHETGYTDWDHHYPAMNDEIHRGMPVQLNGDTKDVVHYQDEHSTADKAEALLEHVKRHRNLGMHWTDHEPAAHDFTTRTANHGDTEIIVHARKPERDDIETDPDRLRHGQVFGYDEHEEAEVPLRDGADVHITGISWRPHPYNSKGRYPANDWVRHNFDNPRKAMARKETMTIRREAHDSGDGERIFHCPFCGAGQVLGRSDGTVECGYCNQHFTVQVQPQFPSFPQTINGMPVDIPGMPGQIDTGLGGAPGQPPMDGSVPPGQDMDADGIPDQQEGAPSGVPGADEGADEEEGDDKKPDFLKGSSRYYRTAAGDLLDEERYMRHLAIGHGLEVFA